MIDLSDNEIDNICDGYVQNAAKIRYLQSMKLVVRRKPNGRPLVNRAHYESVMGCTSAIEKARSDSHPVWGVH